MLKKFKTLLTIAGEKKGKALMLSLPRVQVLQIVPIRTRILFACLMRQNDVFSFFANFSKTPNSKKIGSSSLKVFFRQSFRISDFSNLSSHSGYSQSVTLKNNIKETTGRCGNV